MFLIAASLLIFDKKSPITIHLRPAAHCAASLFLAGVCKLSLLVNVLGKARANNVDTESMTMRVTFCGGKDVD
jgi:hypothetical protein